MTPAQTATLKTAVINDPNLTTAYYNRDVVAIINYLNGASSYSVWKSTTNADEISDAIVWANVTPTDAPDGTALYTNRALMCQAKQINLQILLQGKQTISSNKSNIRTGLQDSLTNVPSGIGGAIVSAGWITVKTIMTRYATKYEQLFATGTGTTLTPGTLTLEGSPSITNVAETLYNVDGSMK